jgi:hypothetical protein
MPTNLPAPPPLTAGRSAGARAFAVTLLWLRCHLLMARHARMKQNPPNPKGSRGWLIIVIMFAAAVPHPNRGVFGIGGALMLSGP